MSFRIFKKNVKYLFKTRLKDMFASIDQNKPSLDDIIEIIKYELPEHLDAVKRPKIALPAATIDTLIHSNNSLCRYGDGEIEIIKGNSIPFQKYDENLAKRLQEIFTSENANILIGLASYSYYCGQENLTSAVIHHIRGWTIQNRKFISSLINFEKQYYATEITAPYHTYVSYDFENYYKKFQSIWAEKEITMICGKTVFDNITYNIFDCAKSINFIYGPSKDAFSEYAAIFQQARQTDRSRLIVIILGPTAKPLAYDLASEGFRALDIGHIAKDYDAFRKNSSRSMEDIHNFYKPD